MKTHWKKLTNPDYLGAYALEDGKDMIVTIKVVRPEMITGQNGQKEECVVAHFDGDVKPMILNKTNMKAIEKAFIYRGLERAQYPVVRGHGIRIRHNHNGSEGSRFRA